MYTNKHSELSFDFTSILARLDLFSTKGKIRLFYCILPTEVECEDLAKEIEATFSNKVSTYIVKESIKPSSRLEHNFREFLQYAHEDLVLLIPSHVLVSKAIISLCSDRLNTLIIR